MSYSIGKNYFENDGTQNYLVFQSIDKYLKFNPKNGLLSEWKSKGLSDKIIKPPHTTLVPAPGFKNDGKRYFVFRGDCLKEDEAKSKYYKIINIYTDYDLQSNLNNNPDFTLENCLLGAVRVTTNTDVDKYKYSGYGIGFDEEGVFTHPTGSFGNTAIIFGVDMSSSVYIDNKGKYILILGKGPTQGLVENSLTAEKMYSINFSVTGRRFCLSLDYNGENSYLFVNGTKMIKFKAKDSELDSNILSLGNISKDFSVSNMKKTGLHETANEFSADYGYILVDNILNIHKYLTKKIQHSINV